MKIGIYGAGSFCHQIDRTIDYIGVDGGVATLHQLGISPIYVVGDFDSLSEQELTSDIRQKRLPCRKDDTDTAIAISEALAMGYDEIVLYGVTGGRIDHFLAVCRLLAQYKDVKITVYDDFNCLYILKPGEHQIFKWGYDYLSFFSLNQATITLKGVAYPLNNYDLRYDDALCVSNEIIDPYAQVITDGYLYCIQSRNGLISK